MDHRLTARDTEAKRLYDRDYAIAHKNCKYCKWADCDYLPTCRLKKKIVWHKPKLFAFFCRHYQPYEPE